VIKSSETEKATQTSPYDLNSLRNKKKERKKDTLRMNAHLLSAEIDLGSW
jgi:hypothetical protein